MMKSPASLKFAVLRNGGSSRSNPSIPPDPDPAPAGPFGLSRPISPVCLNARQKLRRGNGSIGMLMTSILVNISWQTNKTSRGISKKKTTRYDLLPISRCLCVSWGARVYSRMHIPKEFLVEFLTAFSTIRGIHLSTFLTVVYNFFPHYILGSRIRDT